MIAKAEVMRHQLRRQNLNEQERMKMDVTQTGVSVSGRIIAKAKTAHGAC